VSEKPRPTATQLHARCVAASKKLDDAREAMVNAKSVDGALNYCHFRAQVLEARAALRAAYPLRLVGDDEGADEKGVQPMNTPAHVGAA
jgi:hypothetical protein